MYGVLRLSHSLHLCSSSCVSWFQWHWGLHMVTTETVAFKRCCRLAEVPECVASWVGYILKGRRELCCCKIATPRSFPLTGKPNCTKNFKLSIKVNKDNECLLPLEHSQDSEVCMESRRRISALQNSGISWVCGCFLIAGDKAYIPKTHREQFKPTI